MSTSEFVVSLYLSQDSVNLGRMFGCQQEFGYVTVSVLFRQERNEVSSPLLNQMVYHLLVRELK